MFRPIFAIGCACTDGHRRLHLNDNSTETSEATSTKTQTERPAEGNGQGQPQQGAPSNGQPENEGEIVFDPRTPLPAIQTAIVITATKLEAVWPLTSRSWPNGCDTDCRSAEASARPRPPMLPPPADAQTTASGLKTKLLKAGRPSEGHRQQHSAGRIHSVDDGR